MSTETCWFSKSATVCKRFIWLHKMCVQYYWCIRQFVTESQFGLHLSSSGFLGLQYPQVFLILRSTLYSVSLCLDFMVSKRSEQLLQAVLSMAYLNQSGAVLNQCTSCKWLSSHSQLQITLQPEFPVTPLGTVRSHVAMQNLDLCYLYYSQY